MRCGWILVLAASLHAQVSISGRVVDENGAAIAGARVELSSGQTPPAATSSDAAGNFSLNLPEAGKYLIRVERQGFYLFNKADQQFDPVSSQLSIVLNHVQEFAESIQVTASAPAIDPQEPADVKELDNAEILAIPYPASQDFRNALPLLNGVVQGNAADLHFNGGASNQASYSLEGFNIADPATGELGAQMNIESIRAMDVVSSRYSAEYGRGAAGALDIRTKMGDNTWRFGGTNFIPGFSTAEGFHLNKWTPRLELSGPLMKDRAWFYNGFDAFYSVSTVHGLPPGQDRGRALSTNDLSRFQVNLTPANILTGAFLVNLSDTARAGLSILNPVSTTSDQRQQFFTGSIRDQVYVTGGSLLDIGFADTRLFSRSTPQGDLLYEITPFGNLGNYFVGTDRHSHRQQWLADIFLRTLQLHGAHQLKFGIDFEREAFHQKTLRNDYEVLRADDSLARYVAFAGSPFLSRANFEGAQYLQDHWTPREGLAIEAGLRAEWNEIARAVEIAPRFSVAWAPRFLHDTKIAAGYGVYYGQIALAEITGPQDQVSLSTFYSDTGAAQGVVETAFLAYGRALQAPRYQNASVSVERKLPLQFYAKAGFTIRDGSRGFAYTPLTPVTEADLLLSGEAVYLLSNSRHDRYDALDFNVRRTFASKFEWSAGYTRSVARTNEVVNYSLENPVFAPQMGGPVPWDTPNRFHMWGWAPLPNRRLPRRLQFLTHETTAAYLLEYRTGFPFSIVDEDGFLVGRADGTRLPSYFNVNIAFERKFRALHYLWAWRAGIDNITNNGDPNTVNNVIGTPAFLTYGRGQQRALNVRLRFLGKK